MFEILRIFSLILVNISSIILHIIFEHLGLQIITLLVTLLVIRQRFTDFTDFTDSIMTFISYVVAVAYIISVINYIRDIKTIIIKTIVNSDFFSFNQYNLHFNFMHVISKHS